MSEMCNLLSLYTGCSPGTYWTPLVLFCRCSKRHAACCGSFQIFTLKDFVISRKIGLLNKSMKAAALVMATTKR